MIMPSKRGSVSVQNDAKSALDTLEQIAGHVSDIAVVPCAAYAIRTDVLLVVPKGNVLTRSDIFRKAGFTWPGTDLPFLHFVQEIPRRVDGTVDPINCNIPTVALRAAGDCIDPPITRTEEILIDIWCDLLSIWPIGRNDSFFDLGGYSMLALRLVSDINEKFCCRIPLRVVFEYQELSAMANAIETLCVTTTEGQT